MGFEVLLYNSQWLCQGLEQTRKLIVLGDKGMSTTGANVVSKQHRHRDFDYVENPVKGMVSTKAFYSQAFVWKFNEYGPNYAGIHLEELTRLEDYASSWTRMMQILHRANNSNAGQDP